MYHVAFCDNKDKGGRTCSPRMAQLGT